MSKLTSIKIILASVVLLALVPPGATLAGEAAAMRAINTFFPMDNGVGRGVWTPEQQAATVQELGFEGMGYNYTTVQDLQAWLKALDARGLKLFSLYGPITLDKTDPFPAGLREAIRLLKGRPTIIWLTVPAPQAKGDHDTQAARLIAQAADWAKASGLHVVLYPHYGCYVATAEDALRVLKRVERDNVGVTVNLCHELKAGNGERLAQIVEAAAPHLRLVTICGADRGDGPSMGWDVYIKPLGQGNFDVYGMLKTLRLAGYQGPIGLQSYKVPGDQKENLKNSMAAWKKYAAQLTREEK